MNAFAGVILEDEFGRILLQLRDNIPRIANPNQWGLFGGRIETGEIPFEAALREIEEELCIKLSPDRLHPFTIYRDSPKQCFYRFHYQVAAGEIAAIRLTEGQRYGLWSQAEIATGELEGYAVTALTRRSLTDFFNHRATSDSSIEFKNKDEN